MGRNLNKRKVKYPFIVGVGTGGQFQVLENTKRKNPDIKIWGLIPMVLYLKKYHETEF
jgi:hypothetical protein